MPVQSGNACISPGAPGDSSRRRFLSARWSARAERSSPGPCAARARARRRSEPRASLFGRRARARRPARAALLAPARLPHGGQPWSPCACSRGASRATVHSARAPLSPPPALARGKERDLGVRLQAGTGRGARGSGSSSCSREGPAWARPGSSWSRVRYADKEGREAARKAAWEARGVKVRLASVGDVYGIAGHVVDNRRWSLLAEGDATEEGAQAQAKQLAARFGIPFPQIRQPRTRHAARGHRARRRRGKHVAEGYGAIELGSSRGLSVEQVEYGMGTRARISSCAPIPRACSPASTRRQTGAGRGRADGAPGEGSGAERDVRGAPTPRRSRRRRSPRAARCSRRSARATSATRISSAPSSTARSTKGSPPSSTGPRPPSTRRAAKPSSPRASAARARRNRWRRHRRSRAGSSTRSIQPAAADIRRTTTWSGAALPTPLFAAAPTSIRIYPAWLHISTGSATRWSPASST